MAGATRDPVAPDAATIVGLLADDARRLVFAALVLGSARLDDIVSTTGLGAAVAAKALGRLVDAGMVISGSDGALHLVAAQLAVAARAAHAKPAGGPASGEAGGGASDGPTGLSAEAAKVLRTFVSDGRITQIPSAHGKRLVLLDWLAQDFEPGRRYSEPMVNLIIGKRHADTAAWRRYLVDAGILDRHAGEYWRSGGTVATGGTVGAVRGRRP